MTNLTSMTSKTLKKINQNLKTSKKNTHITISSLMMKIKVKINKRSMFYPQLTLVTVHHQNLSNNHPHPKRILMLTNLLEVNKSWMIMTSKSKLSINSHKKKYKLLKKKYNLPNNNQIQKLTNHHKIISKTKVN